VAVSVLVSDDAGMRELLAGARTMAVVGASDDPGRPSYGVLRYLVAAGYQVFPVTPSYPAVQGIPTCADLRAVPARIDIVDVFRRSDQVAAHVDEAIAVGARAVWLQLGVIDEASARRAHEAGLAVVMDRCIKIEHRRLVPRG
jgi:predicted CoA-binding protein